MANTNVDGSNGRSNEFCRISKSYGYKYEIGIDRGYIDKYTMVERCNKRSERRISYTNGTKRDIDRISTILDIRNNVVCKFFLGIFSCELGTSNRLGINMATRRYKCSKYMVNTIVGDKCTIGIRIYIDIGTSCDNKWTKRLVIDITIVDNNTRSTIYRDTNDRILLWGIYNSR
jgi:hypothetical protein